MIRYLFRTMAFAVSALFFLSGCDGGDMVTAEGPQPEPVGLLRKVHNAAELEASIKGGFATIAPTQSADTTTGVSSGAPSGEYSRTYTQEVNVDEFDSVKYDGQYLFVAPLRQHVPCCFVSEEPLGVVNPGPDASGIRILQTDPASAGATQVGMIPLDDGVSVQGLYRSDDRLIAMTSKAFFGSYGDAWASIALWAPEQAGISIYDTTDVTQPALVFEAVFDGVFVESRRIGGTIFVVSRYTPQIESLAYHVTTAAEQAANEALLASVPLADLLPTIAVNGEVQSLVTPENCYVPSDTGSAYPVITSITAIPVADPAAFATTCYNDDAYGVYVSPKAIYLAQSRAEGQATRLHKFKLDTNGPDYAGSVDIEGIVWTGGQADFRLSEKDDVLRAFATKFDSTTADFVDHFLYLLRESPAAPELEVVAQLPNNSRPEEIGKPNEMLYGVRFVGDRAYAVTFEQIDPLFAFDLSDPADPKIAGSLEISGFSDFLHPVGENLLLGLGRSENNEIKLELFDVTVLSRPLSIGSDVLGEPGSFSEAMYDRHAFTYLADVGGIDRFTIPVDLAADDGGPLLTESVLFLYEIRDKTTPMFTSLIRVGSVTVDGNSPVSARSRAVLHNDAIYYLRDNALFSALWTSPGVVTGPL